MRRRSPYERQRDGPHCHRQPAEAPLKPCRPPGEDPKELVEPIQAHEIQHMAFSNVMRTALNALDDQT
jgi:hypothetical protein